MQRTSTHTYRKRLGPWGLNAVVTVRVDVSPHVPVDGERIDGLRVGFAVPECLPARDRYYLWLGVRLVVDQLDALAEGGFLVVRVLDFEVPALTEYQGEAAAAALLEWFDQNLSVRRAGHSVRFDKEANAYVFFWGRPADAVGSFVRQLFDPDPRRRELAADRCADWPSSYGREDVRILSRALATCAATEGDSSALEAQLHALFELGSTGFQPRSDLAPLRAIDRDALPGVLCEYVDDLLDE
ncbi:hypothetical protein [Streptomyces sp. PU-14G]|uniref:hypothetical protein n=1 Tax=Streptomyces sp. PU-14G TaxID=2800808 RepID=UPI0034DEFC90